MAARHAAVSEGSELRVSCSKSLGQNSIIRQVPVDPARYPAWMSPLKRESSADITKSPSFRDTETKLRVFADK